MGGAAPVRIRSSHLQNALDLRGSLHLSRLACTWFLVEGPVTDGSLCVCVGY